MNQKIRATIDTNERNSGRDHMLIMATAKDARFEAPTFGEIDVDVCFRLSPEMAKLQCDECPEETCDADSCPSDPENYFIELKEPFDYVSSALGKEGHLYMQVLTMRELGAPCMILVLGNDLDVSQAIKDALRTRYRGQELAFQIGSYEKRLIDFEANAEALGCPVERWGSMAYTRLLSRVHKRLCGASLMDYRPRPAEGERDLCAASCLFKGLGPGILATVLEDYDLGFIPKPGARPVEDLPGIGKKRADLLKRKIYD